MMYVEQVLRKPESVQHEVYDIADGCRALALRTHVSIPTLSHPYPQQILYLSRRFRFSSHQCCKSPGCRALKSVLSDHFLGICLLATSSSGRVAILATRLYRKLFVDLSIFVGHDVYQEDLLHTGTVHVKFDVAATEHGT